MIAQKIFNDLPVMTGRSLPQESELVAYMNKLMLTDAYDERLELGQTFEQQIVNAENNSVPTLNNVCIHLQFTDTSLSCAIIPPHNDFRDTDCIRYCKTQEFADNLMNSCVNSSAKYHRSHTKASDFYINKSILTTWLKNVCDIERKLFVEELLDKDYLHKFGENELRLEIKSRKKQCPGQKIYVLMGYESKKYYQAIKGTLNIDDTIGVSAGNNHYSYRNDEDTRYDGELNEYESAVIAQSQIRANCSLHSEYKYVREIRRWDISQGYYMKWALKVDKRESPKQYNQLSLL